VIFCLLEDEPDAWRWELRRRQDQVVLARSSTEFGSMDEARQAVACIQTGIGGAPIDEDGLLALRPAQ
jgi:hypothetical protein